MSRILRKAATERSAEEGRLLAESEDLVTELQGRSRRREGLKRRQEEASPGRGRTGRARGRAGAGSRPASVSWQVCDDPEELQRKVRELASAVRNAKYLVVYTGAGISTVGTRGGDDCALDRLPGPGKHGLLELGQAGGAPFWVSDSSTEHSILLSNGTDLQKLTVKAPAERLLLF